MESKFLINYIKVLILTLFAIGEYTFCTKRYLFAIRIQSCMHKFASISDQLFLLKSLLPKKSHCINSNEENSLKVKFSFENEENCNQLTR